MVLHYPGGASVLTHEGASKREAGTSKPVEAVTAAVVVSMMCFEDGGRAVSPERQVALVHFLKSVPASHWKREANILSCSVPRRKAVLPTLILAHKNQFGLLTSRTARQ